MKKILFFTAALLVLISGPLYAGNPKFEINEPVGIYENIIEGEKLVHTFKFKNSGDEKLEIKNMKAKG
jgi:hypothetical protein